MTIEYLKIGDSFHGALAIDRDNFTIVFKLKQNIQFFHLYDLESIDMHSFLEQFDEHQAVQKIRNRYIKYSY